MLYVVIGLLLLHLTLISIQVEDPSGMLWIKRWILSAGAPVLHGTAGISRAAGNFWSGYVWLHGARGENARLREDVRQLQLLNSRLIRSQEENERLRRLLGFSETLPYQTVGAHVIARTPNFLANTLYLDRGADDGIRVNQPVMADGGLIGRTVLVMRHSCQIQLLTNADASVGVLIERSRIPGVLRGNENAVLDLMYISNTVDVAADDVLVTSGMDGIYPVGLPVGRVLESTKGKTGFRFLKVAPSADLLRIEEVLILTGPPNAAPAQPATVAGR